MPRLPPINCLVTFETLARIRNVTRTADALCVCPSTVSQRIKLLESIVEGDLFGGNDFTLTDEGRAYLGVVTESLRLLQSCSFQPLRETGEVMTLN